MATKYFESKKTTMKKLTKSKAKLAAIAATALALMSGAIYGGYKMVQEPSGTMRNARTESTTNHFQQPTNLDTSRRDLSRNGIGFDRQDSGRQIAQNAPAPVTKQSKSRSVHKTSKKLSKHGKKSSHMKLAKYKKHAKPSKHAVKKHKKSKSHAKAKKHKGRAVLTSAHR